MTSFPCRSRSSQSRKLGWLLGAAAMLAAALVSPEAEAKKTRPGWSMAPPLQLQPEPARLTLELPREWMPPPDLGVLGIPFDPNLHWDFRRDWTLTRATIGTRVHLQVSDPTRSIDFGLSVLPRAAIATLRFDPLAGVK